MAKREYCQLAHDYVPGKYTVAGQYMSEKLDGQRAIWDGGVSRGIPKAKVPYANNDRDGRYINPPVATGLWSRNGNVIHAPDWVLDQLPKVPLDLELYAGRKRFQFVQTAVKKIVPIDNEWAQITLMVLDSPPPAIWLADGRINERNCKIQFKACFEWWKEHTTGQHVAMPHHTFEQRYSMLRRYVPEQPNLFLHQQTVLPFPQAEAERVINEMALAYVEAGGEGVVIKKRHSLYACERVHDVLKVKPERDSEATIVGYYWGKEPDNSRSVSGEAGGKYLGLMGSVLVDWHGRQFKVCGFTDQERQAEYCDGGLHKLSAYHYGIQSPGQLFPPNIHCPALPLGTVISFKYRETTDDGLPKEARYHRVREKE